MVVYWFLSGLAWLFLMAAGLLDIFKLWGVISLSERWLLRSIALVIFFLIWAAAWLARYFLASNQLPAIDRDAALAKPGTGGGT
jgi:hypothetical protein